MGGRDGLGVGEAEGNCVSVGVFVGSSVGVNVGESEGATVGSGV